MRTAVTGLGIVSASGIGVYENLEALRNGRSGISDFPRILETSNMLPVGEILLINEELAAVAGIGAGKNLSRTALLGIIAVKEALKDAALPDGLRVGLVSSTSVGGMDLTEHFFAEFMNDSSSGRLRDVVMHDCCASTEAIAAYCGIKGYRTTVSTACSSAANAIMIGDRLIRHGILDCVVAGGADALSAFTLNGFKSLRILDDKRCRPFDQTRAGLNLGEGAGYIVLQREALLDKVPYCFLKGYANRNDAHHQTASSEEGNGAFLAMSDALSKAGISPDQVDYVNVHGTGTGNNDLSEGKALKRLFGDKIPYFSSTKGYTGHALAAAGGIEAVYSALAIKYGQVWPNIHFSEPVSELQLVPQTSLLEGADVACVVSNSFGFGGNCSSIVFAKD
ncbi:MAG: beta-ketoacyl-[Bacteroidales bacterium]|nr:beta-ketoacyl-[acyl-carrier-protein] synthase family protein [Bacteroidales bacterium]